MSGLLLPGNNYRKSHTAQGALFRNLPSLGSRVGWAQGPSGRAVQQEGALSGARSYRPTVR